MRKIIVIIVSVLTFFLITNYYKSTYKSNKYKEYNLGDIILIDNRKWVVIEESNNIKDSIKIIGIDGIPSNENYITFKCNENNLKDLEKDIEEYINALNITLKEYTNVRLLSMEELFDLTEYEEKNHKNEFYDLLNDFYYYHLNINDNIFLKEINTILSDKSNWNGEYNQKLKQLKEKIIINNNTNYFEVINDKVVYKNIPEMCFFWNASYIENDTLLVSTETYQNEIKIQPVIEIMKTSL